MPSVDLSEDTLERLDEVRLEGQDYDDVVIELIDIYEAEGLTLQRGGDRV